MAGLVRTLRRECTIKQRKDQEAGALDDVGD